MTSRDFAIQVVRQLQQAGFQSLWAGGCVRDQLMGLRPKDYDVATNATPQQVQEVFGHRRTLPIGAAFGVITVRGPRGVDPIEVATFRRDVGYSDGRRPDAVEYTDAREDALRRDFTINGMFYDPIEERVLDFVGGQQDLQSGIVRAIGVPQQRIEEDRLRMLRGVRFAATFGFQLDRETLLAIVANAEAINVVSGERIGAEMRRMLIHPNRAQAVNLLRQSGLLSCIVDHYEMLRSDANRWDLRLRQLHRLRTDRFATAAAILLEPILAQHGADSIFQRWKLSNDERDAMEWIVKHWSTLEQADQLPWSQIQPLLLSPYVQLGLEVAKAQCPLSRGIEFCIERLQWPAEKLDPPPLLDGRDLIEMGIRPGPEFKSILDTCRQRQLDGEWTTADQARQWVSSR